MTFEHPEFVWKGVGSLDARNDDNDIDVMNVYLRGSKQRGSGFVWI